METNVKASGKGMGKGKTGVRITTVERGIIVSFDEGDVKLSLGIDELSPEIQRAMMVHGMKQRIADSYAQAKTPQEREAMAAKLIAHYASGTTEWSPVRESGGGGGATSIVVQAFARLKGISVVEALKKVEGVANAGGMTMTQVYKAMETKPGMVDMMETIRRERASEAAKRAPSVDLSGLWD